MISKTNSNFYMMTNFNTNTIKPEQVFSYIKNGEVVLIIADDMCAKFKTIDQLETKEFTKVEKLNLNELFNKFAGWRQSFMEFGTENPNEKIQIEINQANEFLKPFNIIITSSPSVCQKGSIINKSPLYLKTENNQPLAHTSKEDCKKYKKGFKNIKELKEYQQELQFKYDNKHGRSN